MRNDEHAIEQQIQDKGLNAPRLTPDHIDAQIVAEQFHVFEGTALTVCALTLRNGFQVIGMSAAASPENFDAEIGRTISRKNAREQIWALEGYLLRDRLAGRSVGKVDSENIVVFYNGKGFIVSREEVIDNLAERMLVLRYRELVGKPVDADDAIAADAVRRPPVTFQYRGLSYEQASRRAQAICRAAGETGQTINAAKHLAELHGVMELAADKP